MRVITAEGETVSQSTSTSSHLSAVPSGAKIITFDTHREETFLKFPAITSREMKSSWVEEWGRTLSMLQVDVPALRKETVSQQTCSFLATACLHVALKSSTSVSLKPKCLSSSKLLLWKDKCNKFKLDKLMLIVSPGKLIYSKRRRNSICFQKVFFTACICFS